MRSPIEKVVPPNLPIAPNTQQPYQDYLNNVLRLFFTRLTTAFNALISPGTANSAPGGSALYFPYGEFLATTTLSVATINTPTRVALDTTNSAAGMYFVPGDGIHVQQPGVYDFALSVQVTNSDTKAHDVAVWLRRNGVDLAWSDSVGTVLETHGGQPGYYVLSTNFYVELAAGDYIELWWSTNDTAVQLQTLPAITVPFVAPGSPAVAVTVTFVSAV